MNMNNELYDKIYADIYKLRDQIKEDVKNVGGLLMTNDPDWDTIWGVPLFCEEGTIEVVALEVENDELYMYSPEDEFISCEDITKQNIHESRVYRWALDGSEDLWTAQTILNIAECYKEYMNK